MSFILLFLIISGSLFAAAFFTKRRFGVLGLALAAGAILSDQWATWLTPIVEETGLVLAAPPLSVVVAMGLIVAPALILIMSGPTYRVAWQRVAGAAAFALLASVLLLEPLAGQLFLEGAGQATYNFLVENQVYIVTGGLVVAIIDLLFTKNSDGGKRSKH